MAGVMSQQQSWSEALCPLKFSSSLSFVRLTLTCKQEFADLCVFCQLSSYNISNNLHFILKLVMHR